MDEDERFTVKHYEEILEDAGIKLPNGVLRKDVIRRSRDEEIVLSAASIVQELDLLKGKIKLRSSPGVPCSRVKTLFIRRRENDLTAATKFVFCGKKKEESDGITESDGKTESDDVTAGMANVAIKIMLNKYVNTAKKNKDEDEDEDEDEDDDDDDEDDEDEDDEDEEDNEDRIDETGGAVLNHEAKVSKGTDVPQEELESEIQQGASVGSKANKMNFLKFLHREIMKEKKMTYTSNVKVEFGFLKGILNFQAKKEGEKVVIKCKSTKGHPSKVSNDKCKPKEKSANYYQTQAYMYILKKAEETKGSLDTVKGVIVMRNLKNGEFYWGDVQPDDTKFDQLIKYCDTKVLACFLAVVRKLYEEEEKKQKETDADK